MKFKGDIIITDPCYIMRKSKTKQPWIDDYPILKGKGSKKFVDFTDEENLAYAIYQEDYKKWKKANPDQWSLCDYGSNMEALGIKTYLTSDTLYGDWSCHTFKEGTKEVLGQFCADAGLVSVFLLEEVLKYNPDFDYHITKPWTTTLIKDFDGDIEIKVIPCDYIGEDDEPETDEEVRVIGRGNINFYTSQTGL